MKYYLNNIILLCLSLSFVSFLFFRFVAERIVYSPQLILGVYLFLFVFLKAFVILIIIKQKFLPSNENKFTLFIAAIRQRVAFFFEKEFLLKFLDKKPYFLKTFYKIMVINLFLTRNSRFVEKFLLISWAGAMLIFLFDIFINQNLTWGFYFLSVYLLINRLYKFSLYLSMFKLNQLKDMAFNKYLPSIDTFLEKTFWVKNILFINSLLLNTRLKGSKNLVKYLWDAHREIAFFYDKQCLCFILKDSLYPKIDSFTNNINFGLFLVGFTYLSNSLEVKLLTASIVFLFTFYYSIFFLVSEHPLQEVYETSVAFDQEWSRKFKILFLKENIVLKNYKFFKHFSYEEYMKYIELTKIMVIHAKTTEAKKKEELKGIQNTLINELGASVLTYAEMDLLTQEIEKFREWLNQQWDLENINASFEYDPKDRRTNK